MTSARPRSFRSKACTYRGMARKRTPGTHRRCFRTWCHYRPSWKHWYRFSWPTREAKIRSPAPRGQGPGPEAAGTEQRPEADHLMAGVAAYFAVVAAVVAVASD